MNKEFHRQKLEALVKYGFNPDFNASQTDKLYDIFIPEDLSPKAKTEAIKYALNQIRSQAERDLPEKATIIGTEARFGKAQERKTYTDQTVYKPQDIELVLDVESYIAEANIEISTQEANTFV